MMLRRVPAAPLDAFVTCLWASERPALPHARERSLPSGRADLVIALRQPHLLRFADPADAAGVSFRNALVQGPRALPFFRDTSQPSSAVDVQFRAGGAAALLGVPMTELANRALVLEDLWGSAVLDLRERLQALPDAASRLRCLESVLLQRLACARPDAHHAPIAWAVQQFHAVAPSQANRVERVRSALGWSAQRFIAQFEQRVGLTPKRYCRVHRFQSVLDRVSRGPTMAWAQTALECGYADQAHLNREFRAFSGLTPSRYHAVAADQANHVAIPWPVRGTGTDLT